MSKTNSQPTLIYSQHLRCLARLLKNTAQTEVFTYLFDEYLYLIKQGHTNPGIVKSMSTIAENTGIYRGRVEDRLKELAELQLISIADKTIYIRANFLIALANLFYSKPTATEKRLVCAAFQNRDFEQLKKLGLDENNGGVHQISRMNGSIMLQNQQNVAESAECCEISNRDDIATKCCNISTVAATSANCCNISNCDAISADLLISQHIFRPILEEFPTKSDFVEAFYPQNDAKSAKNEALIVADIVYDAKSAYSPAEAIEKMLILQHFLVMRNQQLCCEISNSNKYIKENKKENIQSEALAIKEQNKEVENGNENHEDEEDVFSGLGKPLEVIELNTLNPVKEHSGTSSKRLALSFPMFPVEEVDRIVNDLEYVSSSPLKLFINTVWWILSDYIQESSESDDEDVSDVVNIEGHGFPVEDFHKEVLEVAYEEVESYMNKGCIETEDGKSVQVIFSEMFPVELIDSVFKWEKKALMHDETVYEISKNGIYDISAEKIERAIQPQTREEKRLAIQDGLQYMSKLYLICRYKLQEYDSLTPIEKLAGRCIVKFLRPEETETEVFRFSLDQESKHFSETGAIVKDTWRILKSQIQTAGYTEQEFLSCLLNSNGPNQYEQLPIQPCMFFADGIRTLNKLHGNESVIDTLSIEYLKQH